MDILENASGPDCWGAHADKEREHGTLSGQEGDLGHAGAYGGEEGGHETQDDVRTIEVGLYVCTDGVEEAVFKAVTCAEEVRAIPGPGGCIVSGDVVEVAGVAGCDGKIAQFFTVFWVPRLELQGDGARRPCGEIFIAECFRKDREVENGCSDRGARYKHDRNMVDTRPFRRVQSIDME